MDARPQAHQEDAGDEAQAERIVAGLRSVPPQHATASTVAAYALAAQLLRDRIGSPLWFEVVIALGSHLLENPDGDRGENLQGALASYDVAMKAAEEVGDKRTWTVAATGYANSVVTDPASGSEALSAAITLLAQVADAFRSQGDVVALATCLAQRAAAHAKVQEDRIAHREEAIRLQEEALRLLVEAGPDAGPELPVVRSRARHNLARYWAEREVGVRSNNVDRAVRLLETALEDRPAATDPVGRGRTLRALALLYPEWSGADSIAHAQELADLAAEEARWLDEASPDAGGAAAMARSRGWAALERQRSALVADLDHVYQQDRTEALTWLNAAIENHSQALEVLSRDSMPLRWAEWTGGLARLLGRGPSFGEWQYVDDAQNLFAQALDAFEAEEHPALALQLLARWGELCHEIGDFEGSLAAHRRACDLSDRLLRTTADPDHRLVEISRARGFALLGAYAACRADEPEEALSLAERERMRLQGDLLAARQVLDGPEPARSEMLSLVAEVQRLEQELGALDERDPDVQMERQRATLADALGVDPSVLQVRRTDPGVDEPNPVAGERARLGAELGVARGRMQELLPHEAGEAPGASSVAALAVESGCAVVHLLATVHGGAAVAALPDGSRDVLLLEELTSDLTRELVYGGHGGPGFVDAAGVRGGLADLPGCLEVIASTLGPALLDPLTGWLAAHRVARAVLVPLGSVGLLPLHVAAASEPVLSYAPSARVLRAVTHPRSTGGSLLVADPERDGRAPLPFTVVEARAVQHLATGAAPATVLSGPAATLAAVAACSPSARYVHFGCHGRFRPSDPLASELQLAGTDRISVADLFAGRVDLSGAELVTALACRSGNVEFRRTPDEGLSFPGALLVAGVPSVVSTLWPVEDSASALFTVRFYQLLHEDGLAPAVAVSRARSWLRTVTAAELLELVDRLRADLCEDDRTARQALAELTAALRLRRSEDVPYHRPVHWAAFIHTGLA